MTTPLGPQCLTCRKRRVKCTSEEPYCQRCRNDNLECPGYHHALKVIPYRGPRQPSRRRKLLCKYEPGEESTTPPWICHQPSNDLDYLFLLESFQYFDTFVMPKLIPAGRPFRREKIPRHVPWHMLPKIFQHFMIIWLRSMLPDERTLNWSSRQVILRHRAQGLGELRELLAGAICDPYGVALTCILLLMATDMSLSDEAWKLHLEAARGIIRQRGGLKKCFDDLPDARNILMFYVITEVITSMLCSGKLLVAGVVADLLDVAHMPEFESTLLRVGCLCPFDILLAVARVNELRLSPEPAPAEFQDIWTSLQTFDASDWALSLLNPTRESQMPAPPEEDNPRTAQGFLGLEALAACFQNAALLYLLLSCPQPPDSVQVTQTPRAIKRTLTINTQLLSSKASFDENGPVEAQLWRHNVWPRIISAYARVGWGISSGMEGSEDTNAELDELEATGKMLGSPLMVKLAQSFRSLQVQRARRWAWSWDDGFEMRVPLYDR